MRYIERFGASSAGICLCRVLTSSAAFKLIFLVLRTSGLIEYLHRTTLRIGSRSDKIAALDVISGGSRIVYKIYASEPRKNSASKRSVAKVIQFPSNISYSCPRIMESLVAPSAVARFRTLCWKISNIRNSRKTRPICFLRP